MGAWSASYFGRSRLRVLEMIPRRSFLTLAAAAAASSQASAAGGTDIFHVAIFRFANEHINDAMAACATFHQYNLKQKYCSATCRNKALYANRKHQIATVQQLSSITEQLVRRQERVKELSR
jgi:hypothetical protein